MMAEHLRSRPVVMREQLPQDLKLEMDQLNREEGIGATRFLAFVVGRRMPRRWTPRPERNWRSM
jgi:hypothetical protein